MPVGSVHSRVDVHPLLVPGNAHASPGRSQQGSEAVNSREAAIDRPSARSIFQEANGFLPSINVKIGEINLKDVVISFGDMKPVDLFASDVDAQAKTPSLRDELAIRNLPIPVPVSSATGGGNDHEQLAAAIAKGIATGLAFGVRPSVETAVDQTLAARGADKGQIVDGDQLVDSISKEVADTLSGAVHTAISKGLTEFAAEEASPQTAQSPASPGSSNEASGSAEGSVIEPASAATSDGASDIAGAGPNLQAQADLPETELPGAARDNVWVDTTAKTMQTGSADFIREQVMSAVTKALDEILEQKSPDKVEADEIAEQVGGELKGQMKDPDFASKLKDSLATAIGDALSSISDAHTNPETLDAVERHSAAKGEKTDRSTLEKAAHGAGKVLKYLTLWFLGIHTGTALGQHLMAKQAAREEDAAEAAKEQDKIDDKKAAQERIDAHAKRLAEVLAKALSSVGVQTPKASLDAEELAEPSSEQEDTAPNPSHSEELMSTSEIVSDSEFETADETLSLASNDTDDTDLDFDPTDPLEAYSELTDDALDALEEGSKNGEMPVPPEHSPLSDLGYDGDTESDEDEGKSSRT